MVNSEVPVERRLVNVQCLCTQFMVIVNFVVYICRIPFTVVSDPQDNDSETECQEIGVAELDIIEVLYHTQVYHTCIGWIFIPSLGDK